MPLSIENILNLLKMGHSFSLKEEIPSLLPSPIFQEHKVGVEDIFVMQFLGEKAIEIIGTKKIKERDVKNFSHYPRRYVISCINQVFMACLICKQKISHPVVFFNYYRFFDSVFFDDEIRISFLIKNEKRENGEVFCSSFGYKVTKNEKNILVANGDIKVVM